MLLKTGSRGDDVKAVQNRLGLTPDGIYGQATTRAVAGWQQQNGLQADGIVGDLTWSKMFAVAPARDENGVQMDDDGNPINLDSSHLQTDGSAALSSGSDLDSMLARLKGAVPDAVLSQIPAVAQKYAIDSALRLAHFLAQCAHESVGFTAVRENMNYSADGLRKVFPKYFPDDLADSYARQPQKIGARVYANRNGNGDEASGDGYTYRGRGYIQLTGKSNYQNFEADNNLDVATDPDLIATEYPLLSAAWFWQKNKLNAIADQGATDEVVTNVTKVVNGGTNGLADRQQYFDKYYALLK